MNLDRTIPWLALVLALGGLAAVAWPRSDPADSFRHHEFASLPVLHGGRPKPMDTMARQTLLILNSKQTFGEQRGPQQPAVRWLLDTMAVQYGTKNAVAEAKIFRIENLEVLKALGLEARPLFYRYSPVEVLSKVEILQDEEARIRHLQKTGKPLDLFDTKIMDLVQHIRTFQEVLYGADPAAIAPVGAHKEWQSVQDAQADAQHTSNDDPAAEAFLTMLRAYGRGDMAKANEALAAYRKMVDRALPEESNKAWWETWFNHAELFSYCMWIYWIAVLLGCIAWLNWEKPLNRTAFLLTVLTLTVHSAALLTRMYLQGRPPVTNLYSTAIFIGWGSVLLGLILEWIFLNGIGTVAGALIGALTLQLAPVLGGTGDTLGNLVAVLNTQFWLATHVTIINIGYAATFVAGILGCLFILRGVLSKSLDPNARKSTGRMIYGINCFALFCSFTGTVLGGIWADQSWGRFWGWDPKENGALLIVLVNAIVLHARWCGWAQDRGMALISIFGNLVTGWSWFGTNQLGVGLHAYGFSNELAQILVWFWASQVLIFLIGCIPQEYWRSSTIRPQPRTQQGRRGEPRVPVAAAR